MAVIPERGQCSTGQSSLGSAGAALTLTITAQASKRIVLTGIWIARVTNTAEAAASPIAITTTNLPGSLSWAVGAAVPLGGQTLDVNQTFDPPLASVTAGTNVTIVMPDPGVSAIWACTVSYYHVPEY